MEIVQLCAPWNVETAIYCAPGQQIPGVANNLTNVRTEALIPKVIFVLEFVPYLAMMSMRSFVQCPPIPTVARPRPCARQKDWTLMAMLVQVYAQLFATTMKFYAQAKLLTLGARRRILVSKWELIMRVNCVMVFVPWSALSMKFFAKADGSRMDAEVQTFATQEQPM